MGFNLRFCVIMRHFRALRPRKVFSCGIFAFCEVAKSQNAAFSRFSRSQNVLMRHFSVLRGRKALKCRMMKLCNPKCRIKFFVLSYTAANSRPTERTASKIASIRSFDGFLLPLTYSANKLCDNPSLRAMEKAFSSG